MNCAIVGKNNEVSLFAYAQPAGVAFDWMVTVSNPNNSSNWDMFEPDSYVTVCGTTWAEEAQLKGSML